MRTVNSTIQKLQKPFLEPLAKPIYKGNNASGIFLAVESMKNHMTDEGWQIAQACEHSGYILGGHNLPLNETHIPTIIEEVNPGVVVLQDKREWDVSSRDFREVEARFKDVQYLNKRKDLFKLTILKDSHQKPLYHRESAEEIDCHAWIIYYHPKIVKHLAPYVREEHLIRTYHSIDSERVPEFNENRNGVLLSGAVSGAYPLRRRLVRTQRVIRNLTYLKHPGYHRDRCHTPDFLKLLNQHKVSICTTSIYGYALRKIIESTACGCMVITDLPSDEVMPEIEENLFRVDPKISIPELNYMIEELEQLYDYDKQKQLAEAAKQYYDYRTQGIKLTQQIEKLRSTYSLEKEPVA